MITEDYVPYKIAKLLREKGFNELGYAFIKVFANNSYEVNGEQVKPSKDTIIPTLQMAMKWLREVHNLVVNPVGHYVGGKLESWEIDIYFLDCGVDATIDAMGHIYGKTYESACENGIEYCLEKLI